LAEGPAKLTKQFRRNFERNSNSAGMQELPSMEFHQNGIHGIRRVLNDLDIINKGILSHHYHHHHRRRHPPSPPRQRRLVTADMSSSSLTSSCVCPHPSSTTTHPPSTTSTQRTTWQCHVTYQTSASYDTSLPPHHGLSTTPIQRRRVAPPHHYLPRTMMVQHVNGPLRTCCAV
jgi:hypothetical protein